jgi:hypothetical protein
MANDEFKDKQDALRRKADALEEARGDPAKINELRHQAPAHRSVEPLVTAEDESPKEKAEEKAEPKRPVGRPRMAASRGMDK